MKNFIISQHVDNLKAKFKFRNKVHKIKDKNIDIG